MTAAACTPAAAPSDTQPTEELEMMDGLRVLLYHRVPLQVCYALARAQIRSMDQVRAQTREELLGIKRIGIDSVLHIERALDAIDLGEAEIAIAQDVYGCRAGRLCRVATDAQRRAFEPMIAARLAGWRASHPPRSDR
jgi:hypothetical protein